jgi:hypothetical protein
MFCDLIFNFYKTITKGEIESMIFLRTFGQGPKLVPSFERHWSSIEIYLPTFTCWSQIPKVKINVVQFLILK